MFGERVCFRAFTSGAKELLLLPQEQQVTLIKQLSGLCWLCIRTLLTLTQKSCCSCLTSSKSRSSSDCQVSMCLNVSLCMRLYVCAYTLA